MRIPVLCYHSQIVSADNYQHNGHRALAADLVQLTDLGWRVISLDQLLDWHQNLAQLPERCVALSFDDGMASDFGPVEHPQFGTLPGFLPILEEFHNGPLGAQQPDLHASSFVIVSAQARRDIDQHCHDAIGWDHSPRWDNVRQHPLFSLENHSWDHNHEACNEAPGYPKGTFRSIHNRDLCAHEIDRASAWLRAFKGQPPHFFAYPYGEYSAYLSEDYLPKQGPALGLRAAFTTGGRCVSRDDSPWTLPRFVHGWHWKSPQQLAALLDAAQAPLAA